MRSHCAFSPRRCLDGGCRRHSPHLDSDSAGSALAPKLQRKYIDALGGVQTLIEIDTCHMVMVSDPERLAEILVERCRLYA